MVSQLEVIPKHGIPLVRVVHQADGIDPLDLAVIPLLAVLAHLVDQTAGIIDQPLPHRLVRSLPDTPHGLSQLFQPERKQPQPADLRFLVEHFAFLQDLSHLHSLPLLIEIMNLRIHSIIISDNYYYLCQWKNEL